MSDIKSNEKYTYEFGPLNSLQMIVDQPDKNSLYAGGIISYANVGKYDNKNFFSNPVINANDIKWNVKLTNNKTINNTGDLLTIVNEVSSFPGKKTVEGGEIFNNYTNNQAGLYAHAEGSGTIASGGASHAEGYNTYATEWEAHAEGRNSKAIGGVSHAEGAETIAYGAASHAEGQSTYAEGYVSHAEGFYTYALSSHAHSEGTYTYAKGYTSHAEGRFTYANGDASHAEGTYSIANAVNSHAEGFQVVTYGIASHAEGNNTEAKGDSSHAEGVGTVSDGIAGHTEGYNCKTTIAKKINSITVNWNNIKCRFTWEINSSTFGNWQYKAGNKIYSATQVIKYIKDEPQYETITPTHFSKDFFYNCNNYVLHILSNDKWINQNIIDVDGYINGDYSHAEGYNTETINNYSHAEGKFTIAKGEASHTEGYYTETQNKNSHAEGYKTIAKGEASHAEGGAMSVRNPNTGYWVDSNQYTVASGSFSHAEGASTQAAGAAAHAEGMNTYSGGEATHAEGMNTYALSNYAHAEGYHTSAYGQSSHAEGDHTIANAIFSHAEGYYTYALGIYSHACGYNNTAYNKGEFAAGFNNLSHKEQNAYTVMSVGIGEMQSSPLKGENLIPHNAIEIMNNGDIYINNIGNYKISNDLYGMSGLFSPVNLSKARTLQQVINSINDVGKHTKEGGEIFNYALNNNCINMYAYEGAHAEGWWTQATGHYSHAEGYRTNSYGYASHTEGYLCYAEAYAHAEGNHTNANGISSHTEGYLTTTYNEGEHAQGILNKSTQGLTLSSIGYGAENVRKNAVEVLNTGLVYITGIGKINNAGEYDGTNVKSAKSLQEVISYILEHVAWNKQNK